MALTFGRFVLSKTNLWFQGETEKARDKNIGDKRNGGKLFQELKGHKQAYNFHLNKMLECKFLSKTHMIAMNI